MKTQRAWLTALFVCVCFSAQAGIVSLKAKWPNDTVIPVCFLGDVSKDDRAAIAEIASEWTGGLGVTFDFGTNLNNSCSDRPKAQIRISISKSAWSWSYIGSTALNVPPGDPTLMLPSPESYSRRIVLHHFGHVLGFLSEEQNPRGGCRNEIDFSNLGISSEDTFRPPAPFDKTIGDSPTEVALDNGEYISTGYDTSSVMRHLVSPDNFKPGSKCYAPPANRVSENDKRLAMLVYPKKPHDVSASQQNQSTIRFEGPLAPEHYGDIISELYSRKLITLKKVVLSHHSITWAVAEAKISPRGTVLKSFESFLCSVNIHICNFTRGGTAVWSDVAPITNYVDEGLSCPSSKLPRSVACLPNVRLVPYTVMFSLAVNGGRDSLSKIVVQRYRGCPSWDEQCRTLIKRLNRDQNLSSGSNLIPKTFRGTLNLPGQGYRLVVEYRDESERKSIEDAVQSVVASRAKSLGVDSARIAIEVTYPLRSLTVEAVEASSAAPNSIDPAAVMEVMGFRPELVGASRNVEVGEWDYAVDKNHCALNGEPPIVFDTPAPQAPDRPPPERSAQCGDWRKSDYELNLAYDHGTAVAGLLSARTEALHGTMRSIKPGMPIWAWELAKADQLNQGGNPIADMVRKYALDPKVINISETISFEGDGGQYTEKVFFGKYNDTPDDKVGLDNLSLFVAAAGATQIENGHRYGQKMDSAGPSCNALPACWGNVADVPPRGLVSVVGLNSKGTDLLRDPGGRELTNYGKAFDVAAVGETVSLLHGGYVGVVKGSSFAAAYVTGLAALLYEKMYHDSLRGTPVDVKNRILFTADANPAGAASEFKTYSRFGRINYTRALRYDRDWIRYTSGPSCQEPDECWEAVTIEQRRNRTLIVRSGDQENLPRAINLPIPLNTLNALRRDGDETFTVIYTDAGRLKIISNAQLEFSGDKKISVVTEKGHKSTLLLRLIDEWVSCSFLPTCPGIK